MLWTGGPVSRDGDSDVPLELAGLVDWRIAGRCSHLQNTNCHKLCLLHGFLISLRLPFLIKCSCLDCMSSVHSQCSNQ